MILAVFQIAQEGATAPYFSISTLNRLFLDKQPKPNNLSCSDLSFSHFRSLLPGQPQDLSSRILCYHPFILFSAPASPVALTLLEFRVYWPVVFDIFDTKRCLRQWH